VARHPRPEATDDKGFLTRWSRRKSEARSHAPEPPATEQDAVPNVPEDQTGSTEPAPVMTDADMPPIESIDEHTDSVAEFFSPGVSDELRHAALRKLFRLPMFNVRDGLEIYDDDYRTFEALGDIVTADMKHQLELAKEKAREMLARLDESVENPAENTDREEEKSPDETAPRSSQQVTGIDTTVPRRRRKKS